MTGPLAVSQVRLSLVALDGTAREKPLGPVSDTSLAKGALVQVLVLVALNPALSAMCSRQPRPVAGWQAETQVDKNRPVSWQSQGSWVFCNPIPGL